MRKSILVTLVSISFLVSVFAEKKPEQPTPEESQTAIEADAGGRLPVKRVVLYKNGVGYFEHSTRVHGNQDLAIDFTTSQLNDVLKSLTAVDLGDGRITGVRYNSIAPLDERLKALRLPFGEQLTQVDFLAALRGARVEVHNGSDNTTGRLLSVEKEKRFTDKGEAYEVTAFSVISDAGDMRSFDLSPSTSVRLVEHDLSDEVGKYLNLIGSSRARDLRRMTISASGTGDRDIFVSYISEVPVWKSTYRIILPEKPNDKPLLQGWAIVDNTVGEDWRDVQLSLIAGAPQSFIQDISRPLYTRRPVVPLPQAAMLTPQTQEASMSAPAPAVAQTYDANAESSLTVESNPAAIHGGGVGGGVLRAQASNGNLKQWVAQSPFDAVAKQQAEAEAKDLGDYFEYNLKQKITIGKNQSALVPILQSPIAAEKVTIWNENSREIRRALWITNSSGLTLDSGTFNILENDTFAGEGLIETVHPAERRLISYAADPALRVTMEQESSEKPITRIHIVKGLMYLTREQNDSRKYTLHNADTFPRDVVIEHPARENWKLSEGPKPEETSASYLRFRVAVPSGQTSNLQIAEYHPESSEFALTNLDEKQIALITQQRQITPAMQDAFRRVLDQKNKVDSLGTQIKARQHEVDAITKDQARIRENMKALKGSAEEKALLQRYAHQLDTQEDRLNALNKDISDLQEKQTQARNQLDQIVQQITLDENF
ncbi:MAG TPA: hypothetical protein VN777_17035 [Terriglobales bacterium]|nr:hypothetical protein [Terriglobales bacterium]